MDEASERMARRYARQIACAKVAPEGQRRLAAGRALIVGLGGLGCTAASLLARAGVGFLRIVDDDVVNLEDLHRQTLYDESDAAAQAPKAVAAARRLARANSGVRVEPVVGRFEPAGAEALADGIDVILDATDNFPSRFLINDVAVKRALPWVMAGVAGAEGQTMTIVPGRTPCLRCVYDEPPPEDVASAAMSAGVLGAAPVVLAGLAALEAMKILLGRMDEASPCLFKVDLWTLSVRRMDLPRVPAADCPCCRRRRFEFLSRAW